MALSKQHGFEFTELAQAPSEAKALEAVPESMAQKNKMLPVKFEGDKLTVLIRAPRTANRCVTWVSCSASASIRCSPTSTIYAKKLPRVTKAQSLTWLDRSQPQKPPRVHPRQTRAPHRPHAPQAKQDAARRPETKKVEEKKMEAAAPVSKKKLLQNIAQEASGMPVIKLVTTIIEGAVNSGATDVHLDPQDPEMRVRYRIDGILHDVMSIPTEIENAVISRIKIMSDIDITETRHPQDGHISMEIAGMEYDIRVATLPTFLGERVVLRLLDQIFSPLRHQGPGPGAGRRKDDAARYQSALWNDPRHRTHRQRQNHHPLCRAQPERMYSPTAS